MRQMTKGVDWEFPIDRFQVDFVYRKSMILDRVWNTGSVWIDDLGGELVIGKVSRVGKLLSTT